MNNHTLRPSRALLRRTVALALTSLPAALSACATSRPAEPAANYTQVVGELEAIEQATLDQSWDASLTAMERLGFVVSQRDRSDVEARILAHTQGGREVRIRISKDTTMLSRIRIRVGTFGDESLSRLILERIETHLPVETAEVTPARP